MRPDETWGVREGSSEEGTSELRPGGEEGGSCVTTGGGRRPGEPGWLEVWLPGLGRGAGGVAADGHGALPGSDENGLELDRSGSGRTLQNWSH